MATCEHNQATIAHVDMQKAFDRDAFTWLGCIVRCSVTQSSVQQPVQMIVLISPLTQRGPGTFISLCHTCLGMQQNWPAYHQYVNCPEMTSWDIYYSHV